jgi:hypothetical protein
MVCVSSEVRNVALYFHSHVEICDQNPKLVNNSWDIYLVSLYPCNERLVSVNCIYILGWTEIAVHNHFNQLSQHFIINNLFKKFLTDLTTVRHYHAAWHGVPYTVGRGVPLLRFRGAPSSNVGPDGGYYVVFSEPICKYKP